MHSADCSAYMTVSFNTSEGSEILTPQPGDVHLDDLTYTSRDLHCTS